MLVASHWIAANQQLLKLLLQQQLAVCLLRQDEVLQLDQVWY